MDPDYKLANVHSEAREKALRESFCHITERFYEFFDVVFDSLFGFF